MAAPRTRSAGLRYTLVVCAVLVTVVMLALGTWQVQRLQWKLDLIARVDARVHAEPVPAPGPSAWAKVAAASDEYRHVSLTGTYLPEFSTKVQATTERGSGYWVLTPMCLADGAIVIVNRGFIALDAAPRLPDGGSAAGAGACTAAAIAGRAPATIIGLLRISETSGAYLRKNDPVNNRWYARDVRAIALARGLDLASVAPYFVDAAAGQENAGADEALRPVGGLTVISFTNNHLVYALTWYALAVMMIAAVAWVIRDERRALRPHAGA
jgi:surfeit locus 1 family protein